MKNKMSEFFLELFSEEIPASLQSLARESLKKEFTKLFEEKNINLSGELKTFSTPNRLVLLAINISKDVKQAAEEIRGPNLHKMKPIPVCEFPRD